MRFSPLVVVILVKYFHNEQEIIKFPIFMASYNDCREAKLVSNVVLLESGVREKYRALLSEQTRAPRPTNMRSVNYFQVLGQASKASLSLDRLQHCTLQVIVSNC